MEKVINQKGGSGCIYLITNLVNGKKYIGQHCHPNTQKRWNTHLRDADKGCQYLLHSALRKYGKDAFVIETLCIVPNGDAIGRMEEYFAEQFETYVWDNPGGYNMIWCGKKGRAGIKSSQSTIEKSSAALKLFYSFNPVPEERRLKMSQSMKGRTPPNKGIPISEEKREKCRKGTKAYFENPQARKNASEIMKDYYSKNPISAEQRTKMTSKPASEETRNLLSERTKATWEREHEAGNGRASEYGKFIYKLNSGSYNVRVPGIPSKTFKTLEEAITHRNEFTSSKTKVTIPTTQNL